jgi:hypothetical protein
MDMLIIIYTENGSPGSPVDILCGFGGLIVHRSFLRDHFEDYLKVVLNEKNCRFHDDVYLSNYLAGQGIKRYRIAWDEVSYWI